ncbi:MAG: hypothetical protein ACYTE2_09645, partial [Planctomycetota bacterium]
MIAASGVVFDGIEQRIDGRFSIEGVPAKRQIDSARVASKPRRQLGIGGGGEDRARGQRLDHCWSLTQQRLNRD